ncbi:MAG: metallophosphoesterase [Candidatus Berkelbacteria bacterium]
MNPIFVPDTHGCLRQAETLVDFLTLEGYLQDHVIGWAGDYTDRGPRCREHLQFMMYRKKEKGDIPICGNHEYVDERALNAKHWAKTWFDGYEDQMLESFGLCRYDYEGIEGGEEKAAADLRSAMTADEIDFISNLPLYYEDEKFILIHSTVLEYVSWETQRQELNDWKRTNAEIPLQLRQRTLSLPAGIGKCVVSGHDPRRKVLITPTRASLDLAVFQSGKLPAWIPDLNLLVTVSNSGIRVETAIPPK